MSCNHFLVYDRDGIVAPDTARLCVCTECGMATNVPMEIEIAKKADRYVGPDHPDYTLMLTEAHHAMEQATIRAAKWATGGSCTPIVTVGDYLQNGLDSPGRNFRPAPAPDPWWRRFLRWIGWCKK